MKIVLTLKARSVSQPERLPKMDQRCPFVVPLLGVACHRALIAPPERCRRGTRSFVDHTR